MIDHDKDCGGCVTAKEHAKNGGIVYSDAAYCERCGPTHDSSSYIHKVDGKRYCWTCADIVAKANNEMAVGFGW
jgi:hypothetical protein